MRIPVACPYCQKRGTLPEAMRGQRVTCAGCHQPFVVPAPKSSPKPFTGMLAAMLEEDRGGDVVRPLPLASTRRSALSEPARSTSPAVYAAIGMGGVCALLLAVVAVVIFSKPVDEPLVEVKKQDDFDRSDHRPEPPPVPQPVVTDDQRAAAIARRKKPIEDATVYLKLSSHGALMGGGTGFVIRADKDAVLLATNRHVADAETDDGGKADITAVFRSGQGAALEQSLPAEIVAIDYSREMNHDLAILRVRGLAKPITPIDPSIRTVPSLQMKYSAYGFHTAT
jgi:hypothetical protein